MNSRVPETLESMILLVFSLLIIFFKHKDKTKTQAQNTPFLAVSFVSMDQPRSYNLPFALYSAASLLLSIS